uniref:Tetraspanin n=2 Tax=Nothobranchius korthausae TaxID=1143690 RepID=A0A1A8FSG7_9TELE
MGKINGCLKCVFIFFNVLFGILGCLLIYSAVKATSSAIQMSTFGGPGVGWIWVIALGVFGMSALGIFAACSENSLALKIFAGFMVAGMIIMLIFGTIVAVMRNQIKDAIEHGAKEFVNPIMENEETRAMLESIQGVFQCCGVSSAEDWGSTIPNSCECTTGYGCKPKPQGSSGPALIYSQSCGLVLFGLVDLGFKVMMGFLFGFAVSAVLSLLFSIVMIRQVTQQ